MFRLLCVWEGRYYMEKSNGLTKEQQVFAERNHTLVEDFIRKKRLKRSDFYDVVVFGYLDGTMSRKSTS